MSVVKNIVLPFGEDSELLLALTSPDEFDVEQPIDLTLAGTKVWFTVKASEDDADGDAVLQRVEGAGILLDTPASASKNRATIEVDAADWPADYPGPILVYDVQLKSGGDVTTPFRGIVRCPRGVTQATS